MLLLLVFSTGPMIKQDCVFKNKMIENIKDLKHLRIIFFKFRVYQNSKKKKQKKKTKQTTTTKQTKPCMGSGVIRKINKLSTVSLIFSIKLKCQYYYMGLKYRAMNAQVIERIHLKLLKQLCKLKKLYSLKYGLWRNLRVSLTCQYLF